MFPKLKKKITSFLLSEEGKIPKHTFLSLGSFMSAAVIGSAIASKDTTANHANTLSIGYASPTATATHTHHASLPNETGRVPLSPSTQ